MVGFLEFVGGAVLVITAALIVYQLWLYADAVWRWARNIDYKMTQLNEIDEAVFKREGPWLGLRIFPERKEDRINLLSKRLDALEAANKPKQKGTK